MASLRGIGVLKRIIPTGVRSYSTASPYANKPSPESLATVRTWKILSFLVGLPCCALIYVNTMLKEKEHKEHFKRDEFIPYAHLRIRNKAFPWGDGNHTLFHNPHVVPLPDGYEEEE